jgi:serine/threonine protein kinase
MGIILRGHDSKFNRVVAIKFLAPVLVANAPTRKRFPRETQAAAAVRHQHVVTLYAVEESDPLKDSSKTGHKGLPYLVMEFIDGPPRQEKTDRQGHLERKEILWIGRQVCSKRPRSPTNYCLHKHTPTSNIK